MGAWNVKPWEFFNWKIPCEVETVAVDMETTFAFCGGYPAISELDVHCLLDS